MRRREYPIHPDFKRWARMNPPLNRAALPLMQGMLGLLFRLQRPSAGLSLRRLTVPVGGGADIGALLYEPEGADGALPCLVYFHGGGYVFPAAPYQYALAREYAKSLDCKVLFVDYRLSPGHPFPTAPEDCFAAYCWALERAGALGIDTRRMSVIGDSAGGCLAAVVCMMARERGRIPPRSQILTYPAVGLSLETQSMRTFTDAPMCSSADARKFEALYVQDPDAGKREYRAPLEAADLSGLPPAYIETAQFDCLRDGGILYAEKLMGSAVPVELNNTVGTIHGFDIVLDSPIVRACVERRTAFIKRYWED